MLSVEEAFTLILKEVEPRPPVSIALSDAYGLVLAEDVQSDVDSPPFDKSQMDGFAVRTADVIEPPVILQVVEELTAGSVPQKVLRAGEASRIMTGAPLPEGADAVVPIEQTEPVDAGTSVQINKAAISGGYIARRGTSMTKGETVLARGAFLHAPQLGLMAELGREKLTGFQPPSVSILATGDELVPVHETPAPGQIRNSNETILHALTVGAGARPVLLGIARDNREDLKSKIAAGLEFDILCLSGGVSEGVLDLVPSELQAAGVREVFHKVNIKPGKPIWFGKLDANQTPDGRARWIFGLPGNPVSSMVCFELFVKTAIRKLMGVEPPTPQPVKATLAAEQKTRGDRPTYFPARFQQTASGPEVRPVNWQGSFDVRATADANSMIHFPAGDRIYEAGEMVDVYLWSPNWPTQ